tara:strand:- start:350 stop:1468 length:1119 start_codon:yes stop_codon:yes gene_type:complete
MYSDSVDKDFFAIPHGENSAEKSLDKLKAENLQAENLQKPQNHSSANPNLPGFMKANHAYAQKNPTQELLSLFQNSHHGISVEEQNYTRRAKEIGTKTLRTPMENVEYKCPTERVLNEKGEWVLQNAEVDFTSGILATMSDVTPMQRSIIKALQEHTYTEAEKDLFSHLFSLNRNKSDLSKIDLPSLRMLIHTINVNMAAFDFVKRFFILFQDELKNIIPPSLMSAIGLMFSVQSSSAASLLTLLKADDANLKYSLLNSHLKALPVETTRKSTNNSFPILRSQIKTKKTKKGENRDKQQISSFQRKNHSSSSRKRKRKNGQNRSNKRNKRTGQGNDFRNSSNKGAFSKTGTKGKNQNMRNFLHGINKKSGHR